MIPPPDSSFRFGIFDFFFLSTSLARKIVLLKRVLGFMKRVLTNNHYLPLVVRLYCNYAPFVWTISTKAFVMIRDWHFDQTKVSIDLKFHPKDFRCICFFKKISFVYVLYLLCVSLDFVYFL